MILALALTLLAATAASAGGTAACAGPRSVVGVATVRLSGEGGRASTRLVFAAAVDPSVLRVEIVQGGQAVAVAWSEPDLVRVLVPGEPSLLFEGKATRENMASALGLPFCPEEILFAFRAGRAPTPRCGSTPEVVMRSGQVVALRSPRGGEGPMVEVTFSDFEDGWPRRAKLHAEEADATVTFQAVEERDVPPAGLSQSELAAAVRVAPERIARALGLERGQR